MQGAGNTLIRVRGSVGEVYAGVARRYGAQVSGREVEGHFRAEFARRREGFVRSVSRPHSAERERAWWHTLAEDVFRAAGAWDELAPRFDA